MSAKFFKLFFLYILLISNSYAQQVKRLVYLFSQEKDKYIEKIYVHTDKPQYFAGELMQFKIYNINDFGHSLSSLSRVAYVELLYQHKEIVYQSKILLDKGIGIGSLKLDKTLRGGNYTFRAYTNLMKNGGPNVFFEKEVPIINTFSLNFASTKTDNIGMDIQFFPEGGDMVENIQNNVAFKLTDSTGKGIDITGWIVDDRKDTIARIKPFKFGIGRFTILPKPGRTYSVVFTTSDGQKLIKMLPKCSNSGYALSLQDNGNSWRVMVGTNVGETGIYVVVHNGKKISYARASVLQDGKTSLAIDKTSVDEGLHHLTVFNAHMKPVAERIFYKPVVNKLNFKMDFPLKVYTSRAKVDISLSAESLGNKLKKGYASLSVYRINPFQPIYEVDMVSYLQLSAELKGNIENPNYYFSNSSEETQLALDNLLLTQGWRKFNWDKSTESSPVLHYLPEYNGSLISGKLTDKNGQPSKGVAMYLSATKQKNFFYHTVTDSLGNFIFNTKDIYSNNEIVIQANPIQDTTSIISLHNAFYNDQNAGDITKRIYSNADFIKNKAELESDHFALQAQEIYHEEFEKSFVYPSPEHYNFYGRPYKSYTLSDYTRFNTLEEVLREYVSEVFVYKRQKGFDLRMVAETGPLEANPLVLVDGIPYFDMNEVMKIVPETIEKIELIREKYYYGGETYYGILHLYSKAFGWDDYKINPNALVIDYEGLQLQRELYTPKYNDVNIKSPIPDYRNVIYWNPSIILKDGKEEKLSFYTSDLVGKYRAVVQGVSENGVPGYASFEFEVKK